MANKKYSRGQGADREAQALRTSTLFRTPPRRKRILLRKYQEGNITTFVYQPAEQAQPVWRLFDHVLRAIIQFFLDLKQTKKASSRGEI